MNIDYLCHWVGKVLLVTTNKNHPAYSIQSGGTLNGLFVRNKLIDFVNGESITDENELNKLMSLELLECNQLEDSYIELKYKVL